MLRYPDPNTVLPLEPPDIIGTVGKAWRFDMDALCTEAPHLRPLNVCGWLLFAPYAHPFWHSYALNLIALREAPGVPPAVLRMKGATHELVLMALNPEPAEKGQERYSTKKTVPYLTPANFSAQMYYADDDVAMSVMEQTARDVVNGVLNPDTDYAQHWIARFGFSNVIGDPSKVGGTTIRMGDVEIVIPAVPTPKAGGPKQ